MEQKNHFNRCSLLTARLGKVTVTDVQIQRIILEPKRLVGLHIHPCPVTGYIVKGTAIFQIQGEKEQILLEGSAFYEPKNKRILKFGNYSEIEPLTFIAFYHLNGSQELIKMLER